MAERIAQSRRLIVGLMSGTSVDAIDAALVDVAGKAPRLTARVLAHHERPWSRAVRQRILAVMAPATPAIEEICELNALIAEEFAAAALACIRNAGVAASKVAAIASHGQTVCHLPPGSGKRAASTLQLGDPSVIATRTGIVTVGNFRPADMAAGGQGAPLVPFADAMLLTHATRARCVQNIGGIANVTFLPAGNRTPETGNSAVIAFDTGPGNMLLDAAISLATDGRKRFDKDGKLAARGRVNETLLRKLQAHRYFAQRPPKSTGRELFGMQLAKKLTASKLPLPDLLATLTTLTAWSIADAYRRFLPRLPDDLILCGGGADNPMLEAAIATQIAALRPAQPIRIARIDEFGIPNKSKEATSFALLGAATLDGVAGNVPSVTGARRATVLGVVARP